MIGKDRDQEAGVVEMSEQQGAQILGEIPRGSRLSTAAWLLFFAAVLLAWAGLFWQVVSLHGGAPFGALGVNFAWAGHAYLPGSQVLGMWALMVLAMMLPTLLPMLGTLNDLTCRLSANLVYLLAFTGGYLIVWLAFAILAAGLQLRLTSLGLVDAAGTFVRPGLTLALLLGAGLYQFSALKQACLSACQAPLHYFIAHWRDGVGGAATMGLRHGLVCLGCCWALMALAFVGGTMNLLWMGLATLLMSVEKLPKIGVWVSPLIGGTLLALALAFATHLTTHLYI